MTVSSTTTKNSYSGNGSTTTFAYGFKIFADADLTVILRSSTGVETVQSLTTHYTVTNAGNASGGNVVFGSAPASGVTVVIRRNMALTQSTDYVANDPFPAATHEDALDRLTFISQQMQEEVDRSIKLSRTNTMTSTEFTTSATDRASKVLAFDSSGELSVTQELGTFKGSDATVTTAAYVERDIIKSTTTAELNNVYICVAASVVGDSLTDTDHFALLVDAVSAASSATTATTKASEAATSATNAANSATTATTQASNASTSASTASTQATNAANSATAAQNAQTAAEAALDTFDDRFLGAKSSNPSVDNDGNALLDGALYFDTTNDIMKVYDLTNNQWRQLTLTTTNQNNVNTVAGIQANVTTVAGIASNVTSVAGNSSNINSAVSNASNINAAVSNASNINSAVSNATNINSVVSNASNINTVAGAITNVNNVGGSISNVNTVASNLSGVNSFAERYRVGSSDPSSSNDEGDLFYNTTDNTFKFFNGSSYQAVNVSGIDNLVEDTTPQLGGSLDVNGQSIVSVSGGNIAITPDGSGKVIIDGLSHPTSDGSNGQFLKTDGGGNLSFATVTGTTINNNADNRIITGSGSANTLEGEANLTFDGTTLLNEGGDVLFRNNGGSSVLSLISSTSGTSILKLGDTGDFDIGQISYNNSNNSMEIKTNDGVKVSIDSTGNFSLPVDNQKIRLGASQDLEIFHDGSDSKIVESGTGNLILQSDGTEVQIMNGSEFMGRFQNDGAVKLFHDNSKKFETTSGGVTVTGTVSATNLNLTTGDINVTGTGNRAISVLSDDGLGTMEIGGATGGFLDIKQPKTDDFDIRLGSSGSGGYLTIASGAFTFSGGLVNSVSGYQSNGVVLPFQSTPVEASTGSSISIGTSYTTVTSVAISHDSNDTVLIFASFQLDTQSSSTSGQGDFRILATNTSQSAELNVNTILAESARLRWQQAYIAQDLRGITAVTTYHIQVRRSNGLLTANGGGGTSRLLLIKKTA